MDYFLDNWGSVASVLGLVVTAAGGIISYLAFRRAGKARDAAAAAEVASKETRAAMVSALAVVDLQRAIALLQRLKALHRDRKWEIGLEQYQPLRAMLADIEGRHALPDPEQHKALREAIPQLQFIEDAVASALAEGREPSPAAGFDQTLNSIQTSLEGIASATYFADREGGQ